MRKQVITMTSQGVSEWMPVDRRGSSGDDYLIIIDMESGRGTADFEFSPDRPEDLTAGNRAAPSTIVQHNILKDVNESCASTMIVPFQSFRLNVKKHLSGSISLIIVQGGQHGN